MPRMSRVYSFFFRILLKLSFLFANMCVGPGVNGLKNSGGPGSMLRHLMGKCHWLLPARPQPGGFTAPHGEAEVC